MEKTFGQFYSEAKDAAIRMTVDELARYIKILRGSVKHVQLADPQGFMKHTVKERATIIAYTEILIRKGGSQ